MNANEKLQGENVQIFMHSLETCRGDIVGESLKNRINGWGGGVKNLTGMNKSLSLFHLDEFILFQILKKERNPVVQRFYLVPKMLCHVSCYFINRLIAITMFPEIAADFIQFYFIMGLPKLWQNVPLEKGLLNFGLEKDNKSLAVLLPPDVSFGNKLEKVDFFLN